MRIVFSLIVNTLSVFLTAWILGDAVRLDSFGSAIVVAIVLALLNFTVKPLLILFTIPATVFTFGLFLFVINALIIQLADHFVSGFAVAGFGWALLFSLILSIVSALLKSLAEERPQ